MFIFVVPVEHGRHDTFLPRTTEVVRITGDIFILVREQVVDVNSVKLAAQLAERRRSQVVRHLGSPHFSPAKILLVRVVMVMEEAESVGKKLRSGEVVRVHATVRRHEGLNLLPTRPKHNGDCTLHESVSRYFLSDVVPAVPAVLQRQIEFVFRNVIAEVALNPRWVTISPDGVNIENI